MAYEIEFLPVGNGERSGDAIVLRWEENGSYRVGVIDGGTKESGEAIVEHINKYYGTNTPIEFVLNTHPDSDHCSGLTVVLEKLPVKTLWMHRPWEYSDDLLHLIDDDRVSEDSLEKRLKENLSTAYSVFKLAKEKKVQVFEPFQGQKVGPFTVLSPSLEWYKSLVVQFRNMPKSKPLGVLAGLRKVAESVLDMVDESLDVETLREGGQTSAENNSSVVLFGALGGTYKVLLTGDAGIEALNKAADYANSTIPNWRPLKLVQIPHHGSRRNVSPSVLDKILGPKRTDGSTELGWAAASASKESKTHPRKSVINAFIRRGYNCYATQGSTKYHYSNSMPGRGWSNITPMPFSDKVESYD